MLLYCTRLGGTYTKIGVDTEVGPEKDDMKICEVFDIKNIYVYSK